MKNVIEARKKVRKEIISLGGVEQTAQAVLDGRIKRNDDGLVVAVLPGEWEVLLGPKTQDAVEYFLRTCPPHEVVTVLVGGSGVWNLHEDVTRGEIVAKGHVPNQAPFEEVCSRQIVRQSNGSKIENVKVLRGGHLVDVPVPKGTREKLGIGI